MQDKIVGMINNLYEHVSQYDFNIYPFETVPSLSANNIFLLKPSSYEETLIDFSGKLS